MKKVSILLPALCWGTILLAQGPSAGDPQAAYVKTIKERSAKIVAKLGISDSSKFYKVRDVIAQQYIDLNDIYTRRDATLKQLKEAAGGQKPDTALTNAATAAATRSVDSLHPLYLKRLKKQLKEEQVDEVKNGMTFNVLNVTYTAYQDMIPTLTEAQKKQLYDWLLEAREHAMDAESSDRKHWWFGKYKGRINNYLSKEGYDVQKERAAWEQRIKEKKAAS
jgi:hypothetical protein